MSNIISNNNHNHHNNSHRISNGTQACAACKYQRRKCAPDCVLAPYFPHDRQRQFLNAHKLFGVSNITKIIRNLNPPDKDIAMRTIIYQSDARAKDPVGGCYRIIRELHHQIEYYKAELELVLQQITLCKAQAYQQSQLMQMNHPTAQPLDHPQTLQNVVHEDAGDVIQEVACNSNNNDNDTNYNHYQTLMRCYYEDQENDQAQYVGVQQNQENENNDHYSWVVPPDEAVLASSNSSTGHEECFVAKRDFGNECDGLPMKLMRLDSGEPSPYDQERHVYENKFNDSHLNITYDDHIHDEGLKFGSQPTKDLSEEIVLKEDKVIIENQEGDSLHHHIAEHELRNAATMFTLTH